MSNKQTREGPGADGRTDLQRRMERREQARKAVNLDRINLARELYLNWQKENGDGRFGKDATIAKASFDAAEEFMKCEFARDQDFLAQLEEIELQQRKEKDGEFAKTPQVPS